MKADERLWLREIVSVHDPMLQPCRQLYESSFPADERVPTEALNRALERRAMGDEPWSGQQRLAVSLLGSRFAGFCSFAGLLDLESSAPEHYGAVFYMAVVPELRGRGAGRFMFQCIQTMLAADACWRGAKASGLILEVERPDMAHDAGDRQTCEKRIKFYERLGCRLLQRIDYVQPTLDTGLRPLRLHLMSGGDIATRSDRHICRLWYRLVFGLGPDDPTVVAATTG